MSWPMMPTFAVGVLATAAVAVLVWCRGPARADSAVTDRLVRALPVSLRVLAIRELFRIPLFGPAMRIIGMIEVDRECPDFRRIDQAAARDLEAGHWLLAFPEGRILPDGAVGEFKDGAFVIAVANQVPVVPVAIHGSRLIWPPEHWTIRGGQERVVAESPLQTTGLTEHDVARLREQARDVIGPP